MVLQKGMSKLTDRADTSPTQYLDRRFDYGLGFVHDNERIGSKLRRSLSVSSAAGSADDSARIALGIAEAGFFVSPYYPEQADESLVRSSLFPCGTLASVSNSSSRYSSVWVPWLDLSLA
jgi:hypothetical protein